MSKTVLCYIIKENKVLMLHRVKRENDLNEGKWLGLGGHIEKNETPESALLREIKEEANLDLISYDRRGIVNFYYNNLYGEKIYVFTSSEFGGILSECDEGILKWVNIKDVNKLNLWEGDRIFLDILFNTKDYFEIDLYYENDKLIRSERRL